ncbi:MAG: hypothetical protein GY821_00665, partial [Gammaproteobacteria bacterium]|nr:hypothetical protein [Gammaproteobacteria bacterium]
EAVSQLRLGLGGFAGKLAFGLQLVPAFFYSGVTVRGYVWERRAQTIGVSVEQETIASRLVLGTLDRPVAPLSAENVEGCQGECAESSERIRQAIRQEQKGP